MPSHHLDSKKKDQVKLYIVIGLSVIMILVAYFRFFHKKDSQDQPRKPPPMPLSQVRTSPDRMVTPVNKNAVEKESIVSLPPMIRDIFSPPVFPETLKVTEDKVSPSKRAPDFRLKGTIVGGGKGIAIIDDQFLRQGDMIGEYRVITISKNKVILNADGDRVVLEVLNR